MVKSFILTLLIGIVGYVLGRVEQYQKQKRKEEEKIDEMLEVLSASITENNNLKN